TDHTKIVPSCRDQEDTCPDQAVVSVPVGPDLRQLASLDRTVADAIMPCDVAETLADMPILGSVTTPVRRPAGMPPNHPLFRNRPTPHTGAPLPDAVSTPPATPAPEEVVRQFAVRVYNLVRWLLINSPSYVEQVTEKVLLEVLAKLATFRDEREFNV